MKGPIARGTVRTTFVLGLRLLVQAGTLLLVARLLGPQQFGAFAGIASLAVILGTLSSFGTHLVLLGEVSKDPARRQAVLPYAVPGTLLCGGVLLAIYLLVCTLALRESGIAFGVLLAIGIAEIWLQPLFGLPTTEHLALGRVARSQILQTLPLALRLCTAIAASLVQPDDPLAAYAWGYLAASLIALALATTTMPGPWPRPSSWRFPRGSEFREALGFAALNITKTGPAELDKTLALRLLPLGMAGVYSAGARVIGAITLPITAMTLASLPRLFREGQTKSGRTAQLPRWMFGCATGYSVALAGALWLAAPMFDWIFGTRYNGLGATIRWLCLAIPGMSLRLVAGNILMAMGKPWMRVGFETIGLVILIAASFLLTMRVATIGMPLALACSEWAMAAIGSAMAGGVLMLNTNPGKRTDGRSGAT